MIALLHFILALLGVPLFLVIGSLSLALFTQAEIETSAVIIELYRLTSSPAMITIPLFTFAGYLMAESNSPQRMLRLANCFFGHLPGGVAIVALIVCAFFTAFTGASGVTIIALGGLIYPILKKEKYSENFSLGLVTTSGSLGLLFPPSLPLILYAVVAQISVDQLFLAGLIPGTLILLILALYASWQGKEIKTQSFAGLSEMKSALYGARYEIPLPFIVLGGIYGGYLTTTEVAAVTLSYVILTVFIFYKDLSFQKDFSKLAAESSLLVGSILIILCCALGLTNYLVDEQIPEQVLTLISDWVPNKWIFLLALNVFLLIIGSFMDIFSAIIVILPLLVPLAAEYNIHPIHMAIIFLTNLEIGYLTPPVGINLFISSFRFQKSMGQLYRATFPYFLLLLLALALITYIPEISLFWVKDS